MIEKAIILACTIVYVSGQMSLAKPYLYVRKNLVKTGESFTINCHTDHMKEDDKMLIKKNEAPLVHPSGNEYSTTPNEVIMSINGEFGEELKNNDRYTISDTGKDRFNMTITVSDSKPWDTATFHCRMTKELGSGNAVLSDAQTIIVEGPIRKMDIHNPSRRTATQEYKTHTGVQYPDLSTIPGTFPSPEINIQAGEKSEVDCAITVGHHMSQLQVKVFLGDKEIPDLHLSEVNKVDSWVYPEKFYDELMTLYYYWDLSASLGDSGKEIKCQANLSELWSSPSSTAATLVVTGPPSEAKCDPVKVKGSVTEEASLVCSAFAMETQELTAAWEGPDGTGNLNDITNKRDGMRVTSTLLLSNVTKTHFGKYSVTWTDNRGSTKAEVELVVESASGARGLMLVTSVLALGVLASNYI